MKQYLLTIILFIICSVSAQPTVSDFGYTFHQIEYNNTKVEFIVKSKKGEEMVKKPILLFIQGSLPKPLIKYNDSGTHFSPFPFRDSILTDKFHLVCINKPGIPSIANTKDLTKSGEYKSNSTGLPTNEYTTNENLPYYVDRNLKVIEYLINQPWVDTKRIVVAGHSEGSSIALKMAINSNYISHLIYSGGTPYFSRILSIISQDRNTEDNSHSWIEDDYIYWKVVNHAPKDTTKHLGYNSNYSTYTFSENLNDDFKLLNIPTLITYGTKDEARPYIDMLRVELIQVNKSNIVFKSYINREHNYFSFLSTDEINYNDFGWDIVGEDWFKWISKN